MQGTTWLVVSALAIAGIVHLWNRYSLLARRREMCLQYGCQEPIWYPHTDRLRGSDLTLLRKQAIRNGRLKMLYLEQHRTLGDTWVEKVDGQVRVLTIRRENVRHVFATRARDFQFRPKKNNPSFKLIGSSGFFGNYEDAKEARKLIMPTFTRYENGTMPMLKAHVDRFIEALPRDSQAFDMQPMIKRLFIDLSTEFLFNVPLGMQLPENREAAQKFVDDFDATLLGLNKRRQGFTFSAFFKLMFDDSFDRGVKKIHNFVDEMIQAAIDRADEEREDGKLSYRDLETDKRLGRYILVDEMVKQTRDRQILRDCMIQAFVPARQNSAILVSNTFWALSRNPEYWHRVRPLAMGLSEEEMISFPKLANLGPIRHLVLEAVRLCGPGGANGRGASVDVVLPKGGGPDGESPLFLPAGTLIGVHTPVMHRNKRYWGEDADEYRPERFEGRDIAQDFEFIPFLAGPKACPAKHQVIVQATYILVRLLREFETIQCTDEIERFVEDVKLTTESKRGCQIALIPTAGQSNVSHKKAIFDL